MSKTYWGVEHSCEREGIMERREYPELHWLDDDRRRFKCDVCNEVVVASIVALVMSSSVMPPYPGQSEVTHGIREARDRIQKGFAENNRQLGEIANKISAAIGKR